MCYNITTTTNTTTTTTTSNDNLYLRCSWFKERWCSLISNWPELLPCFLCLLLLLLLLYLLSPSSFASRSVQAAYLCCQRQRNLTLHLRNETDLTHRADQPTNFVECFFLKNPHCSIQFANFLRDKGKTQSLYLKLACCPALRIIM